ncbi:MAG: two-component system, OmpR family, sensor histidine kinase KdpD [Actinomycetota bacterium]|jgi:signal transduction histidine kinase|nr:two-component system, OmpR family, sensor histidine kinase KdpD [Actinomycetota bacterium]
MTIPAQADRHRRDRAVLAAAVAAVLITSALIVFTVLKAERDGTQALERLQQSQVEQLARSMNTRIETTFVTFAKFIQPLQLTAKVNDPGDKAQLKLFDDLLKNARTGFYVVDKQAHLSNGALLKNGITLGTVVNRPGLDGVLAGKPAILSVAPGLTTALPTVGYAFPITRGNVVVGAFVFEADVSPQADFSAEVAQLKAGKTGDFSFVDAAGVVVASSDTTLLGKKLNDKIISARNGFHRYGDRVGVVEPVPAAQWRAVFRQDSSEFDGALTGPLKSALVLIVLAGTLAAGVGVVFLARRLRAAREEQRRLQEVSAVREEFISIVSHELRTPVAGLLGFLQTTLDHWEGMADDERRRAIGRSLSSARRLHALTRDVLDTGSMEAGGLSYSFSTTDLRDEVGSAVLATQDVMPDRTIRLNLPDDPTWVSCDRERITQVLTNLLDNAIKSAPGSPLDVTVATRNGSAVVSVADQGPGMNEAELARVFDKFVRGRTSTPAGTGLGLYICKQIVNAHGGDITATSTEGRGATVSFTLPLVAAPVESAQV